MIHLKSQIATTEEQSKKLIKLGILPNTSDMYYWIDSYDVSYYHELNIIVNDDIEWGDEFIPAWSLSRLIELIPTNIYGYILGVDFENKGIEYSKTNCHDMLEWFYIRGYEKLFDGIIQCIEWLIERKHFNKKYLNK